MKNSEKYQNFDFLINIVNFDVNIINNKILLLFNQQQYPFLSHLEMHSFLV